MIKFKRLKKEIPIPAPLPPPQELEDLPEIDLAPRTGLYDLIMWACIIGGVCLFIYWLIVK